MAQLAALLTEIERREIARQHLDSSEAWLRRTIEYQLKKAFGQNYWEAQIAPNHPVISPRVQKAVMERRVAEPLRYARNIDATTLDDAISLVLHPKLYPTFFRTALERAYPDGEGETRTFLTRLKNHRNKLVHGGICSQRTLEQCVCYSNDLVESLKAFFVDQNMERAFNVPTFTRVHDNKGNDFHLESNPDNLLHHIDVRTSGDGDLYPGDELVVEVEVDQSFSGYSVRWITFNGDRGNGSPLRLTVEQKHVGAEMIIRFEVVSAEQWHKLHGGCDDRLDLRYRVLPPK